MLREPLVRKDNKEWSECPGCGARHPNREELIQVVAGNIPVEAGRARFTFDLKQITGIQLALELVIRSQGGTNSASVPDEFFQALSEIDQEVWIQLMNQTPLRAVPDKQ